MIKYLKHKGENMKRLNSISLLRCISWIFIVTYHILSVASPGKGLMYFPFNFAVQVFIFISGLLYSKKQITDVKSFYNKNIFKILLPVNILLILEWILVAIVDINRANPLNWISFMKAGRYALDHLWFIPFILLCYILLPVLQKTYQKNKLGTVAKCFVIFLIAAEAVWCVFIDVQVVFLVFILGYYLGRKSIEENISIKGGVSALLFAAASACGYFFARNAWLQADIAINIKNLYLCIQHYMIAFIALGFALAFLYCFKFTNKHKPYWICKFSDKYSFHIYLHHQMFIVGAMSIIGLTPSIALDGILIFIITLATAIVMHYLEEILNKKVFQRIKLKNKNKQQ